ncbi:PaaI family thioesterase [Trinickia fusca]|uniref:PaaI family thioesterase n=1 Tax=Trinickia fusca TaxID=2419777 RepID=A0A494XB09_9BURK|nr:PaaI family thioesterase [Trinickia fusca]RKP45279.1 PaaI family thioesterase [Trinickia fusca]
MSLLSKDAQIFLATGFKSAPVAKTMGLILTYDDEGNAQIAWKREPGYDHGMGDTHGGIFCTMLDSAGWFTVAAQCKKMVVTSDLHVRMLQPAKQQDLVATARMVRSGGKLAVASMELHSADGQLVATGTASFAILGDLPI